MAGVVDEIRWWTKPKTVFLSIAGAIGVLAALISNSETVASLFGIDFKKSPSLSITVDEAINFKNFFSTLPHDDSDTDLIGTTAHIAKNGPGVLHDCKFNVWADGVRSEVTDPKEPIVIPDGSFEASIGVNFLSTSQPNTQSATISLICDKGGTSTARFRVRPKDPNLQ